MASEERATSSLLQDQQRQLTWHVQFLLFYAQQ
jgi:hypothetical protein